MLERSGGTGGAAAQAGGIIYLGGGTATQIGAGITDTPEAMEAYLLAACGPAPDRAKIALYARESVAHHDWFVAHGVEFEPTLTEAVQMEPVGTEGLVWSGGENAWPFNASIPPAPRGHLAKTPNATGWLTMKCLHDSLAATSAEIRFDTSAERLIVDGSTVVGVRATSYGETHDFFARGGVVIAAGGFVHNEHLLSAYAPTVRTGSWKVGTDGDDGRGISMLIAMGAQMKSMHAGECALPLTPPKQLTTGILVNRLGQRFINEDTYNGRIGQRALYRHDATIYLIVDEEAYAPTWLGLKATVVAETVDEIERELGFVPGSLESTISLYNRYAEHGEDPLFHKDPAYVRPLVGPLGVMEVKPNTIPYAVFTLGGAVTTVDGEVVHVDGSTIPGLFAAGRTTSGICSFGYASGLSIGDSTFFGRRAGRAAAQRA
jgi:3-oxo-5alpha-steroid 4-dehydrogenase